MRGINERDEMKVQTLSLRDSGHVGQLAFEQMEALWPETPKKSIKPQLDPAVCWWCGGKGDAREHRIKRTVVIREFGPGIDRDTLHINRARVEEQRRGPNAGEMKFRTPLCVNCNSARSQRFDYAEVAFTNYYRAHEEEIVRTKILNLAGVFPLDLQRQAEDLRRYFVKHAACVINDLGFDVSQNVRSYLDGTNPLTDIAMSPHVCESMFDIMAGLPAGTPGPVGYDDASSLRDPKTGLVYEISGNWVYRSLHIHWAFRWMRTVPTANPFSGNISLPVDPRPVLPVFFGSVPPKKPAAVKRPRAES